MYRTRSTFTVVLVEHHDQDEPDAVTGQTYDERERSRIDHGNAARQLLIDALSAAWPVSEGAMPGSHVRLSDCNTEFIPNTFRVTVKMRVKGPSQRRVERQAVTAIQGLGWCDGDASYGDRRVDSVVLIQPSVPDAPGAAADIAAD